MLNVFMLEEKKEENIYHVRGEREKKIENSALLKMGNKGM